MSLLEVDYPLQEITSRAGYALLQTSPNALLIDVRTKEEWTTENIVDLTLTLTLSKKIPLFLSWQNDNPTHINPDFITTLKQHATDISTPLLFLCRKGVRSYHAAHAALKAGYKDCYSLSDGMQGWVASQLPFHKSEPAQRNV